MFEAQVNGKDSLEVSEENGVFRLGEAVVDLDVQAVSTEEFHLLYKNRSFNVLVDEIDREEKTVSLRINGKKAAVKLSSEMDRLLKRLGMENLGKKRVTDIKAPMPGLIHSLVAEAGQTVAKGDALLILEAMKMENVIKSPDDGVVKGIHVEPGASVDKGALLVTFE